MDASMVGLLGLLALVAGVFFLSGVAQAVTGFGSALVAIPLLTLAIDPVTAVVSATAMSLGLAGWAAVREREHLDRPTAGRMVAAGLVGIPLGMLLLLGLSDAALQVLMAVTILGALLIILTGSSLPASGTTTWSTGMLSGTLLAATGMNGPPLVVGLQSFGLEPREFRATLQAVFAAQDLLVVIAFVIAGQVAGEEIGYAAVGALASPLGWLVGDRVFAKVSAAAFRWVLVVGLLVSAAVLVLSALSR